jgi:hypothetical protein
MKYCFKTFNFYSKSLFYQREIIFSFKIACEFLITNWKRRSKRKKHEKKTEKEEKNEIFYVLSSSL